MLLRIVHSTLYEFDQPMRWIVQSHRLIPSECASQRTREWSVTVEGAEFGASFTDGAGDVINTMTLAGPIEKVEVLVEGVVETTDTAGVLRGHREVISPRVYLTPTAATTSGTAIEALRKSALEGAEDATFLSRAHRMSEAVAKAIAYAPGSTEATTTASEAVERGSGVCQDHAHALIALAHGAGMPARYVTGYLMSGDDAAPEEASHAWAEIFVDGLGWIGFDPANESCPDDRYVRLGSGRDAADAAPIRGVTRGGGIEAMNISVVVSSAQQ